MQTINSASLPEESGQSSRVANQTFSDVWARKYLQKLAEQDDITEALSRSERAAEIAQTLTQTLRATSAQAWAMTEALLAQELVRHQIDPRSIDPWAVAKDAHQIYEITLNAYAQQLPPPQLSTLIAWDRFDKSTLQLIPGLLGLSVCNFTTVSKFCST